MEKICVGGCAFYPLVSQIHTKIYASKRKSYSTNIMMAFRDHNDLIQWQQCHRMMKYYLGYYGWIPAIITALAAAVDVSGILPSVAGKIITLFIALLSLGTLWLQKPEKDENIALLESMQVKSPSFIGCVWYLSKYRLRQLTNRKMPHK